MLPAFHDGADLRRSPAIVDSNLSLDYLNPTTVLPFGLTISTSLNFFTKERNNDIESNLRQLFPVRPLSTFSNPHHHSLLPPHLCNLKSDPTSTTNHFRPENQIKSNQTYHLFSSSTTNTNLPLLRTHPSLSPNTILFPSFIPSNNTNQYPTIPNFKSTTMNPSRPSLIQPTTSNTQITIPTTPLTPHSFFFPQPPFQISLK